MLVTKFDKGSLPRFTCLDWRYFLFMVRSIVGLASAMHYEHQANDMYLSIKRSMTTLTHGCKNMES